MATPKQIIIRIQSAEHGTSRLTVRTTDNSIALYEQVTNLLNLTGDGWILSMDRKNVEKSLIKRSKSKTIRSLNLRHGDMIYLTDRSKSKLENDSGFASRPDTATSASYEQVSEDVVDVELDKADGKIYRKRSEQMCRHGPSNKCIHCVPLEPFDETYLKQCEPPIKFLSFHSYIRKLRSGVDKGKFVNLENLSCKIKADCKEHAPWPAGICTKCQPNAVTLNRQVYRHIDYVTFENGDIMDRFLNYWRNSGRQRAGFLIGRYEPHPDIPLGIRAIVCAIYEPPQKSSRNSLEFLEDPCDSLVDELAGQLGMQRVGWILTDLVAQDLSSGTVRHTRGTLDSYFLSAEECIMAAEFQNKYPNKCRYSSEGHYGSKFVTVIVTGDKDNQIHFEGYQVSDQCMGLVRDNCLIPTFDAPELGYIKESSNEQYIPDVFYKEKDKYGNEITQLARPLPVEYLLTDMSVAFPKEPMYSFSYSTDTSPFPIANRLELHEIQDLSTLSAYMNQFTDSTSFLKAVSSFHVLLFMASNEVVPLREVMMPVLQAVRDKDADAASRWATCEQWSTMQHLLEASAPAQGATGRASASFVGANASPLPPIGATWQCQHCTFINHSADNCEMCGLPKAG